jgi:hypothetical protein
MKLTSHSRTLIPFFIDDEATTTKLNHINEIKDTNEILEEIYHDIYNAHHFLNTIKHKLGAEFYEITMKKIMSVYHIPKPKNFNSNSFPQKVRQYIDEMSLTEICYSFSLFERNIKLYFITEELDSNINIQTYNKYVETIVMWLYILNEYASKKCSKNFTVYFYFTSLKKNLPDSNVEILDENHVNTAFTSTCPRDSEIIIFRREEWLKVFIHETFHNFALDFSDMSQHHCKQKILSLFPVNSDVNLYESYTEFWAEFMNCCLTSFIMLKNKNRFDLFLKHFYYFIDLERKYSFFQMVKTLDFMGLHYKDLYKTKNEETNMLRNTMYKENTNVLSYYIIKTILINHYPQFLHWCKTNNLSLLQFKKTETNLDNYCDFIGKYYKSRSMLECVKNVEEYLYFLKKHKHHTKPKMIFLLNNMRMSICELG